MPWGKEDGNIGHAHCLTSSCSSTLRPLEVWFLSPLHHWNWYLQTPGIFLQSLFSLTPCRRWQPEQDSSLLAAFGFPSGPSCQGSLGNVVFRYPALPLQSPVGLWDNRQITGQGPNSNTVCFLKYFLIPHSSLHTHHPQVKETSPSSEFCLDFGVSLWLNLKYNYCFVPGTVLDAENTAVRRTDLTSLAAPLELHRV